MCMIGQALPNAHLVNGKVPASELPSYVDDVIEYNSRDSFPETGESGKIYVALDTNITYRWSGSSYIVIGSNQKVFYGTCSTGTSASTKIVTVDSSFVLAEGVKITIYFANAVSGGMSNPKYLNVNSSGAYSIAQDTTTDEFVDIAGNTIQDFVFKNSKWVQTNFHKASGTDYGSVILEDDLTLNYDASYGRAATPKAVRDLNLAKVDTPTSASATNVPRADGNGGYEWSQVEAQDVYYEDTHGIQSTNVQDAVDYAINGLADKVDKATGIIPPERITTSDWTDAQRLAVLLSLGCTVDDNGFVKWTAQTTE